MKHRRMQICNAVIATVAIIVIALAGTGQPLVLAQGTLSGPSSVSIASGGNATLTYTLTNTSTSSSSYTLSGSVQNASGWSFDFSTNPLSVNNNTSATFSMRVNVPSGTTAGTYSVTVTAVGSTGTVQSFLSVIVTSSTGQISLSPSIQTITGASGQTGVPVTLTLTNSTPIQHTFSMSSSNRPNGVTVRFAYADGFAVPANSSITLPVFLDFSSNVDIGQNIGTLTVTATTQDAPVTSASAFITISTTAGTTATPTGCPDSPDPGGDRGSAMLILVNVAQRHGICAQGDEDWFKFGAVGNKVYTIDVPQMDDGLDLMLELYDEDGNLLTSNDDFFLRNPATPDAKDIKPQIHSWRAPSDGMYYIRIRDNLNIGGSNTTYTIIVQTESYGPTPITVTELCRDIYEEDGLPEQATLITSNEVQYAHVLCPTGDADWVRFFALRGKTYYIGTDTRPYKNNPDINNQTEAGADTVIYLADRDGVSIIDFNDDLEGGGSLDSELRFSPSADGFYYLQVKNVGDIGNQFIKYDLTLKLCVPGQECGRSPVVFTAPTTEPVPTSAPFDAGTTPTAQATATVIASGNFSQSTYKPGPMVNGPLQGFADQSFEQVWQRNDRPIVEQQATRSWTWGPHGLMARTEGYMQSASGLRQVQYFDKGRMEVNDPHGDRNSPWFVTTGLLVNELVTGRTQIGDNQFVQRVPADIPIAGDPDDPNAPTYASFGGVSALQPGDRTGQLVVETLGRDGQVGTYTGAAHPETQLVHFAPETGHNIPRVFWDTLNATGKVYENKHYNDARLLDWVFTLGFPISEPYWAQINVGGVPHAVLVQPFQRRVLTYSPDNPIGWQVEMGNVGRHYYLWRYGEDLPA